jgi:Fe2+ transport system protein FeoA
MGLETGTEICAVRVTPPNGPVEVSVGNSKVTLGKGMASKVFVDLEEASCKP